MFCIKVFSLPFSAWSCTSYFRCDRTHQGLHYLLIKSSSSNFLRKMNHSNFLRKMVQALCHAIPRALDFPWCATTRNQGWRGSVVTVTCLLMKWHGSKCASRVRSTTFGNGRFHKKYQPCSASNNDYFVYNGVGVHGNIPGVINNTNVDHDASTTKQCSEPNRW